MEPRLVRPRALNRALLARQLLLERADLDLPRAVEQVAGIQAQYAPSIYVGLWSRVADLRREAVTEGLARRELVQATLLRATIHVVSAADFPWLAAAVRRGRAEWWLRAQRPALAGVDLEALVAHVRAHLADGPLRARDLEARLAAQGYPKVALGTAGMFVDLVRAPPSGTWDRRRADLYALADRWLPDPGPIDEVEARVRLARRYLNGFGPASLGDLCSWAGLPAAVLRPAVEALDLRRLRAESGEELLDLPDAPRPDPDTPAPVRFLPTWDATLLVHARRKGVLPERWRPRVFSTKTPQSIGTFLVDGEVAGTWRPHEDRIVVEPFEPLPPAARREVDDEAERLAAFHFA